MRRFDAEALTWLSDRRHTLGLLDRDASVAFVRQWYDLGVPLVEARVEVEQQLFTSRVERCDRVYIDVPQHDDAALMRLCQHLRARDRFDVRARDVQRLRMLRRIGIAVNAESVTD